MVFNLSAIIAVVLYVGATLHHLLKRVRSDRPRRPAWLLAVGALALIFHGYAVFGTVVTPAGINFSLWPVSVLILLVVNGIVLLSSIGKPLHNLVVLLFPATAVVLLCSLAFGHTDVAENHLSPSLGIHVIFSLLAYSLFTIATVQALLLGYQDRQLRNHHPGGGFLQGLPPLQTMETLLFEFIWAGFLFLSLALLTGFLFVEDILGQHLAHKMFFSVVGWIIYATLLAGRLRLGWRGSTAIRWTVGGFILLALAYWGSKFVLEVIIY